MPRQAVGSRGIITGLGHNHCKRRKPIFMVKEHRRDEWDMRVVGKGKWERVFSTACVYLSLIFQMGF